LLVHPALLSESRVNEQGSNVQFTSYPAHSYQPVHNFHQPTYNPEFQNRQGVGGYTGGFFNLAGPYVTGLVTTFAFVFGTVLFFDLIFGDANIIKRITGRDGRALTDLVTGIDMNTVMTTADQVYTAIDKFNKIEKADLPK
jgi:hypothetical protein